MLFLDHMYVYYLLYFHLYFRFHYILHHMLLLSILHKMLFLLYNNQKVTNLRDTAGTYNLYANWTLKSVTLPSEERRGHTLKGWSTVNIYFLIDFSIHHMCGMEYRPKRNNSPICTRSKLYTKGQRNTICSMVCSVYV